jgi:TetR/AcrR family transcriptional regulator, upper aerobic nicotinate degradation pathway regulator
MSAAKKLFAQRGFDGTTIRDVSDAAGVNVSLISYNFGGKAGLLKACIGEFAEERLKRTQEVLIPIKTKEEFILRFNMHVKNFLEAHAKDLDIHRIISLEMQKNTPLFQELLENIFLKTQMTIGLFFKIAQDSGVIRKDLEVKELTIILQGILSYNLAIDHIRESRNSPTLSNPETIKTIMFHIQETFLNGILG